MSHGAVFQAQLTFCTSSLEFALLEVLTGLNASPETPKLPKKCSRAWFGCSLGVLLDVHLVLTGS